MQPSHLQKKIAKYILVAATEAFQKEFHEGLSHALVSVSNVWVTADLQLARIYISVFPIEKANTILNYLELEQHKVKYAIHHRLKNKLRKMPELVFFIDDTLHEQEKVNQLLEKSQEELDRIKQQRIEQGLDPEPTFNPEEYKHLKEDDLL